MATVTANIPKPLPVPPTTFTIECNAAEAQLLAALCGAIASTDAREIFGPDALGMYETFNTALRKAGVKYIGVRQKPSAGSSIALRIERRP